VRLTGCPAPIDYADGIAMLIEVNSSFPPAELEAAVIKSVGILTRAIYRGKLLAHHERNGWFLPGRRLSHEQAHELAALTVTSAVQELWDKGQPLENLYAFSRAAFPNQLRAYIGDEFGRTEEPRSFPRRSRRRWERCWACQEYVWRCRDGTPINPLLPGGCCARCLPLWRALVVRRADARVLPTDRPFEPDNWADPAPLPDDTWKLLLVGLTGCERSLAVGIMCGLTQSDLAAQLGVHRDTIHRRLLAMARHFS
jgi:hypothetical protein